MQDLRYGIWRKNVGNDAIIESPKVNDNMSDIEEIVSDR